MGICSLMNAVHVGGSTANDRIDGRTGSPCWNMKLSTLSVCVVRQLIAAARHSHSLNQSLAPTQQNTSQWNNNKKRCLKKLFLSGSVHLLLSVRSAPTLVGRVPTNPTNYCVRLPILICTYYLSFQNYWHK